MFIFTFRSSTTKRLSNGRRPKDKVISKIVEIVENFVENVVDKTNSVEKKLRRSFYYQTGLEGRFSSSRLCSSYFVDTFSNSIFLKKNNIIINFIFSKKNAKLFFQKWNKAKKQQCKIIQRSFVCFEAIILQKKSCTKSIIQCKFCGKEYEYTKYILCSDIISYNHCSQLFMQ